MAEKRDQSRTSANSYWRSEMEFGILMSQYHVAADRQESTSKCFFYVLLFIVLVGAAALFFCIAVHRVSCPGVKISSVTVDDFRYATSPVSSLNATLTATVIIHNKNFGRFRFEECHADVSYRNWTVGGGIIHEGQARARKLDKFSFMMQVRSNYGISPENENFKGEVNSGVVHLSSYAQLEGRVRVLKIMNKWMTAEINCTMALHLQTRHILNLNCF